MKKFEYLIVVMNHFITVSELNELGAVGWELITQQSIYDAAGEKIRYEFKREITL